MDKCPKLYRNVLTVVSYQPSLGQSKGPEPKNSIRELTKNDRGSYAKSSGSSKPAGETDSKNILDSPNDRWDTPLLSPAGDYFGIKNGKSNKIIF